MSAALVQCQQTKRYFVFDVKRSNKDCLIKFIINLQVNCDYSASIIESCLRKRTWCALDTCCLKRLSDTAIPVIQIGDFENIDWESVLDGSQIASSYLVRKGLSRKAQLAMQIKRFSSKNRDSILKRATPFTLILETWSAFEDMRVDFGNGTFANFDTNMIMDVALRQRLEWCLEDVKLSMEDNHCDHWILKPSVTNKGVDIAIIKSWDSLLDAIEAVPDIREWVLQK
jgi:Tubulin-tyrosine ligase family